MILGCSTTSIVRKTDDGVEFELESPGKISYKDSDIEVTLDTRKPSTIQGLIELYGIDFINGRGNSR